jgi:hypothetical protein
MCGMWLPWRHRVQPQRLQRHVIQLSAVICRAHSIVRDHKIKSFYFRAFSKWRP